MGSGDYIKNLVSGVRGEIPPPKEEVKSATKPRKKPADKRASSDFNELLESMRKFEINGDTKRLIRIDSRTEEILRLLSPTFRVDVTSFVNFLCWDFLENNPELIDEIKQSLKNL